MDQPRLVHHGQRPQNGAEDGHGLLHAELAALVGHVLLQGDALHIFHDDVGGVVGQEEVAHLDDLRGLGESGQHFRLPQEALLVVAEAGLTVGGADGYVGAHGALAHHHLLGEIFLHRHRREAEMEQALRAAQSPEDWLSRMEETLRPRLTENSDNYTAAAVFC